MTAIDNDEDLLNRDLTNLLLAFLCSSTQTQDQVKSGLLLDVVVAQGTSILELLAGEDEALLVGGDALLVLDLGLDVINRVRGLHLKGDSLARKGLYEAVDMSVPRSVFPMRGDDAVGLFSIRIDTAKYKK